MGKNTKHTPKEQPLKNNKEKQSYQEKFNQYKANPDKPTNSKKTNKKQPTNRNKNTKKMKQYSTIAIVALGIAGSAVYNKVTPGSFSGHKTEQHSPSSQKPNKPGDYIKRDYNKEQPPFDHSADGTLMGKNPGETDNGKATFTSAELAFVKDGWIRYGKLDSLGRPTTAEAVINKALVDKKIGTSANRDIRPPGFKTGNEPYGHSRGHLIGKQFGGDGNDKRNLVTMIQEPVNSPLMTDYENYVRWAVSYKRETVRMRVIPIYQGKNLVPSDIQIEAQSMGNDHSINFNVTIPNIK